MTKYAVAILNMINNSNSHMTAEDVFVKLKERMPSIVLATVYNNLSRLSDKGLIRKIAIEGGPDRYDKTIPHDHMVCSVCGKISDMYFSDLTKTLQNQTDEKIISYDLKVKYICSDCREKGGY